MMRSESLPPPTITRLRASELAPAYGFTFGDPLADYWAKAFRRLADTVTLKDDWDGDGAKAPLAAVRDTAARVLRWLRGRATPPLHVGPGNNGNVILVWQSGKAYFEIDIVGTGEIEWMQCLPGDKPRHGEQLDAEMLDSLRCVVYYG